MQALLICLVYLNNKISEHVQTLLLTENEYKKFKFDALYTYIIFTSLIYS